MGAPSAGPTFAPSAAPRNAPTALPSHAPTFSKLEQTCNKFKRCNLGDGKWLLATYGKTQHECFHACRQKMGVGYGNSSASAASCCCAGCIQGVARASASCGDQP